MRRALLVGAGNMGRNWARTLQAAENARLAGWVDLRGDVLEQAATGLGLEGVALDTDLGRALATIRPDFVVDVTVPGPITRSRSRRSRRGCRSSARSRWPTAWSTRGRWSRRRTGPACSTWSARTGATTPSLAALRRLIADQTGPLGILNSDFSMGARERGHRLEIASPLLLDMAIHAFDTARYLSGADPVSVYCEEFNPPWSWYRGNACAMAMFEMTGGVRYTYRGSWCSEGHHTDWDCEWRAVGPNGSAVWKGGDDVPVADIVVARGGFLPETELRPGEVVPAPAGIAGSLPDFLHALDTGATPMGECHDNIKSLAMVFGAIESAATGRRVSCRLWDGA